MRVDQVNVEDRRALAHFIRLERELLGHHPRYVAPLDADVRKQLSGKSASSIDTDSALFLLSGNGDRHQPLGRLVAYVNRRWQAHHGEPAGFTVNEGNRGSRRLAESFGGIGRTVYTVYDKTLTAK